MISLIYQLCMLGPALYCHIGADRHCRLFQQALSKTQARHPETAGSPLHRWKSFLNRILQQRPSSSPAQPTEQ